MNTHTLHARRLFFSGISRGPCNNWHYLGHVKHVDDDYDDDADDDESDIKQISQEYNNNLRCYRYCFAFICKPHFRTTADCRRALSKIGLSTFEGVFSPSFIVRPSVGNRQNEDFILPLMPHRLGILCQCRLKLNDVAGNALKRRQNAPQIIRSPSSPDRRRPNNLPRFRTKMCT